MKRSIAWAVAAVTAAALLFPVKARAISAQRAVLYDATGDRILFEKCPDAPGLIASTTKIMTALVVCQRCNVLDRVRIPREAVGVEGSSMYLQAGEVLTVQELLYGLMLHSGNDAAVALAIYCGGTVEGFAQLMNDKARVLGLEDTHFVNPHGLDAPDHYSTARDMARLAAHAMEDPVFAMTVSTKSVRIGDRYLRNHNKLLWRVEGADGVKTGYTKAAGRILVSSACREGRRLICVTMNAPDDWHDHTHLLEKGFSDFACRRIVSCGQTLGEVPVAGGLEGVVRLLADKNFDYALARGEQVRLLLPGPGFVYAPVKAGEDAGNAHVLVNGRSVGTVPLVYGETIRQISSPKRSFIQRLLGK